MDHSPWPEKELSFTGRSDLVFFWIFLAVAIIGLATFIGMFLFEVHGIQDGWIAFLVCGLVALFAVLFAISLGSHAFWPRSILHACKDVLSDVPNEPLIEEGTFMHSKIRHELANNGGSIIFRPIPGLIQSQQKSANRFFMVFSVFFLPIFSYGLHLSPLQMPLLIAVITTIILMTLSMGFCFSIFYLTTNFFLSRLTSLIVPASGPFAELDVALPQVAPGFKTNRQTLNIPRDQIAAIQLCPYSFPCGDGWYRGLQGLLVQKVPNSSGYQRYVLLNCTDKIACAKMMEQLAKYLRVPFLFGADAEGWKEEEKRIKNRPELSFKGAG